MARTHHLHGSFLSWCIMACIWYCITRGYIIYVCACVCMRGYVRVSFWLSVFIHLSLCPYVVVGCVTLGIIHCTVSWAVGNVRGEKVSENSRTVCHGCGNPGIP